MLLAAEIAIATDVGTVLAYAGPPIAELMAVIGSTLGIYRAASVGLSVLSENPRLFTQVLMLSFLPATQAMAYGLVFMFFAFSTLNSKIAAGPIDPFKGAAILTLSLFVGAAELWSAYKQGQVCGDGAAMLIKTEGKLFLPTIILAAYEELFGILGMAYGLLMLGIVLG